MPKFKFGSDINLNNTLSVMGMPAAFNPKIADFFGYFNYTDVPESRCS